MDKHMSPAERGHRALREGGYSHGGHVDVEQDKKMVTKAIREHENQDHGGRHAKLSLRKGGRIKGKKAKPNPAMRSRSEREHHADGGDVGRKKHGEKAGIGKVNIVIAHGDKDGAPGGPPAMAMPPPRPMAPPPGAGMPPPMPPRPMMPPGGGMPPPGAMPPPMPMHADGGHVARGHRDLGGGMAPPTGAPMPPPQGMPPQGMRPMMPPPMQASGGAVRDRLGRFVGGGVG